MDFIVFTAISSHPPFHHQEDTCRSMYKFGAKMSLAEERLLEEPLLEEPLLEEPLLEGHLAGECTTTPTSTPSKSAFDKCFLWAPRPKSSSHSTDPEERSLTPNPASTSTPRTFGASLRASTHQQDPGDVPAENGTASPTPASGLFSAGPFSCSGADFNCPRPVFSSSSPSSHGVLVHQAESPAIKPSASKTSGFGVAAQPNSSRGLSFPKPKTSGLFESPVVKTEQVARASGFAAPAIPANLPTPAFGRPAQGPTFDYVPRKQSDAISPKSVSSFREAVLESRKESAQGPVPSPPLFGGEHYISPTTASTKSSTSVFAPPGAPKKYSEAISLISTSTPAGVVPSPAKGTKRPRATQQTFRSNPFESTAASTTPSGSPFGTPTPKSHGLFGQSSAFGHSIRATMTPQESTLKLSTFTTSASGLFGSSTVPTIKVNPFSLPASSSSGPGAATPPTPTSSSPPPPAHCNGFSHVPITPSPGLPGSIARNDPTSNPFSQPAVLSESLFGDSSVHASPSSTSRSKWLISKLENLSICRTDETDDAFRSLPHKQQKWLRAHRSYVAKLESETPGRFPGTINWRYQSGRPSERHDHRSHQEEALAELSLPREDKTLVYWLAVSGKYV